MKSKQDRGKSVLVFYCKHSTLGRCFFVIGSNTTEKIEIPRGAHIHWKISTLMYPVSLFLSETEHHTADSQTVALIIFSSADRCGHCLAALVVCLFRGRVNRGLHKHFGISSTTIQNSKCWRSCSTWWWLSSAWPSLCSTLCCSWPTGLSSTF